MKKSLQFLACATLIALIGGCATSRSELDIQPQPQNQQSTMSNGKQVFINAVTDLRVFQANPTSPNIPSLDPSENQTASIKHRAVGRKRNAYGMAMGDLILKDGQTVESLTTSSIKQAFAEKGYTVINSREQVSKDTYVIDANIDKFWAWMNPGFVSITLSAEISTAISIKSPEDNSPKNIYVKAADGYQLATESNWSEIIGRALRLYIDDLKSKLR